MSNILKGGSVPVVPGGHPYTVAGSGTIVDTDGDVALSMEDAGQGITITKGRVVTILNNGTAPITLTITHANGHTSSRSIPANFGMTKDTAVFTALTLSTASTSPIAYQYEVDGDVE